MNRSIAAGLLGFAIVAVALLGYSLAEANGQIVFVPASGTEPRETGAAEPGLTITNCLSVDSGLQVEGSVDIDDLTVTVAVWQGDERDAGVRVGQAYAQHAGLLQGARTGDFVVVLPWATMDAQFAVVDAYGQEPDFNEAGLQRCP